MSESLLDFLYDNNNENNDPNNIDEGTNEVENKSEVSTLNDIEIGPCIPKQDTQYTENQQVDIPGQQPLNVSFNIPDKPSLEHEIEMWDAINTFEEASWDPTNTGLDSGWESINKGLDGGINPGFIIIGGDSNLGKSGFISQLGWQIAENNDNVYVMDFSLDDPMPDKLSRVIGSGNKVLLNAVKHPVNYQHIPLMLIRRKEALNKLRASTTKYHAYDSNFTSMVEEIEEEIKRVKINLEMDGQGDKQIVVLIDSFHDLNIRDRPQLMDKQKYDFIAQWCADVAIKYDIPLISTAELKKLNGTRRPMLDDIREAVKIKYEAKAILLVYNEVHYQGEGSEVYFLRSNTKLKQPVFEVHFAKNKFHSFKGRAFFEFYPEMARMEEVDEQSAKNYASLAFGN